MQITSQHCSTHFLKHIYSLPWKPNTTVIFRNGQEFITGLTKHPLLTFIPVRDTPFSQVHNLVFLGFLHSVSCGVPAVTTWASVTGSPPLQGVSSLQSEPLEREFVFRSRLHTPYPPSNSSSLLSGSPPQTLCWSRPLLLNAQEPSPPAPGLYCQPALAVSQNHTPQASSAFSPHGVTTQPSAPCQLPSH